MRVLVLGGGPAGATAALQAREFGADVTLVEEAGPARFVDPHTVPIPDGRAFGGDAVIVAVGGMPVGCRFPAPSWR